MFSVLVLGIMILLISATSIANAQQYDSYYEDDRYYYEDYDNEYVYDEYYYPPQHKDKKHKESPMLLVDKEILFCDVIANGTSISCVEEFNNNIFVPKPDSNRYVQDCTNIQCQEINASLFTIKITDNIKFQGSEEGTKLNFNGERFTVTEEFIKTELSEDIKKICQDSGFYNGGIIKLFTENNNKELEFASCVLFEGECSDIVQNKELKECTVENYVVAFGEQSTANNVVITWVESIPGDNRETFAAMSSDSGATFGNPVNVSDTTTNSFNQQIAMSGENVVITWRERLPGNNDETFAAMSSDSGATFGNPVNVSDTTTNSFNQQIAMSGENVVITWRERLPGNNDETFAAMSSDSGATFGNPVNVSDTTTPSFLPQIAMSGENVVITWVERLPGNNGETFAAMSSDSGATFGNPVNVSDTTTDSDNPQIAMSGENVVITWVERLPGNNGETFAAMSSDSGATFGNPVNVSDTTTDSDNPQIAMN